jgi:hypothetical protein
MLDHMLGPTLLRDPHPHPTPPGPTHAVHQPTPGPLPPGPPRPTCWSRSRMRSSFCLIRSFSVLSSPSARPEPCSTSRVRFAISICGTACTGAGVTRRWSWAVVVGGAGVPVGGAYRPPARRCCPGRPGAKPTTACPGRPGAHPPQAHPPCAACRARVHAVARYGVYVGGGRGLRGGGVGGAGFWGACGGGLPARRPARTLLPPRQARAAQAPSPPPVCCVPCRAVRVPRACSRMCIFCTALSKMLALSCWMVSFAFASFSWLASTIFQAFSISFLSAPMVLWSSSLSFSAVWTLAAFATISALSSLHFFTSRFSPSAQEGI